MRRFVFKRLDSQPPGDGGLQSRSTLGSYQLVNLTGGEGASGSRRSNLQIAPTLLALPRSCWPESACRCATALSDISQQIRTVPEAARNGASLKRGTLALGLPATGNEAERIERP